MSKLICPMCEEEIRPGDQIELIYAGDEEPRILMGEDAIAIHATCKEASDEQTTSS